MLDLLIFWFNHNPLANAHSSDSSTGQVKEPRALASGNDDKKQYQAPLPKAYNKNSLSVLVKSIEWQKKECMIGQSIMICLGMTLSLTFFIKKLFLHML